MAQFAAVLLLLLHVCLCFPLLPWEEIMGSNTVFSFQKCLPSTLLQVCFLGKLGWHRNFHHTTTTKPPHPNPKKHIRKKPPTKQPPSRASILTNSSPPHLSTPVTWCMTKIFPLWKIQLRRIFFLLLPAVLLATVLLPSPAQPGHSWARSVGQPWLPKLWM